MNSSLHGFGFSRFNVNRLLGIKSPCKKKRRKNKRKKRKPQGFYPEYDELDQEEYEDQYNNQSQEVQEEETSRNGTNDDQTKCDQLLEKLLALVPGMIAGQASHYNKLVEQFKGTASQ